MQRQLVESIRSQLLELQQTCRCLRRPGADEEEEEESRKRQRVSPEDEEQKGAKRRGERRGRVQGKKMKGLYC